MSDSFPFPTENIALASEYGKQVMVGLSQQLKQAYVKDWSEQRLRHCLYAAETYNGENIFYALCRELSCLFLLEAKTLELY